MLSIAKIVINVELYRKSSKIEYYSQSLSEASRISGLSLGNSGLSLGFGLELSLGLKLRLSLEVNFMFALRVLLRVWFRNEAGV